MVCTTLAAIPILSALLTCFIGTNYAAIAGIDKVKFTEGISVILTVMTGANSISRPRVRFEKACTLAR